MNPKTPSLPKWFLVNTHSHTELSRSLYAAAAAMNHWKITAKVPGPEHSKRCPWAQVCLVLQWFKLI